MEKLQVKNTPRLKVQEMFAELEISGFITKVNVRRHKDYKTNFSIEHDKRVVKEGSIRSVNLQNCLLEVVRANKYLSYYNPLMAWSTYKFEKAFVDIRLHSSGDGSWEVRIRYNNGNSATKNYPESMAQGDVMNSLIPELGLPDKKGSNININN